MNFVCDPDLALYLPLHELDGGAFKSRDSHGHLATITGALWTPGGRYFDGNDDVITIADMPQLNNAANASILGWFNLTTIPDDCYLFGKRLDSNHNTAVQLYTDNLCYVYIGNSGSLTYSTFNYSGKIVKDKWFFFALLYDGNGVSNADKARVYLNMEPQTLSFSGAVPATLADTTGQSFRIGNRYTLVSAIAGLAADFLIYGKTLTLGEAAAINVTKKWRYG